MNKVSVLSLDKKFKKLEAEVKGRVLKILKALGEKEVSVHVYLLGDKRMKALCKEVLNDGRPHNVLSFEEPIDFPHPETHVDNASKALRHIGEIYVNLDEVNDYGRGSFSLNRLLVHGVLHLSGYKHEHIGDRMKMEKKEKQCLILLRD